jgi:hypothetical protein
MDDSTLSLGEPSTWGSILGKIDRVRETLMGPPESQATTKTTNKNNVAISKRPQQSICVFNASL